ncbi:MAG: inorganic diphosphatase [bacterium]
MIIDNLSIGKNAPEEVNVIIEIPAHTGPVKYEVDKDSGALMVDRVMGVSMVYPCNYGFVPHTLAGDGDPIDVLVVTSTPLVAGCVVAARPVGVLKMTDEGGEDAKILAVPTSKLTKEYDHVKAPGDLGEGLLANIKHFFERYKELETGKWVKVEGWEDAAAAVADIKASIDAYNK